MKTTHICTASVGSFFYVITFPVFPHMHMTERLPKTAWRIVHLWEYAVCICFTVIDWCQSVSFSPAACFHGAALPQALLLQYPDFVFV